MHFFFLFLFFCKSDAKPQKMDVEDAWFGCPPRVHPVIVYQRVREER